MTSRKIKKKDKWELKRVKEASDEAVVTGPMDQEEVDKVLEVQKKQRLEEYVRELQQIGLRGRR